MPRSTRAKPAAANKPVRQPAKKTTRASKKPDGAKSKTKRKTKKALLIELLSRPRGATINDMVEATGWLPHTVRAALTRLRQAGHRIIRQDSEETGSVYRISDDALGNDEESRS